MNPPPDDPWLNGVASLILLASAITWITFLSKRLRDGVLLEYAPRRPVPWGSVATVMALALALLTVASAQPMGEAEQQAAAHDSADAAWMLVVSVLPIVILTAGFAVTIALVSGATAIDLGFPLSAAELARDVWIGVVACLAAVLPVFGALGILRYVFELEDASHHPLIEIIGEADSGGVLLLATAITVLVAPVCEEITFRLLLQGWLEKWDVTRRRAAEMNSGAHEAAAELFPSGSAAGSQESNLLQQPSGWLPILVSSLIFAAAHFGYGPEPLPIFILAIVLGYVYRQTHRIIPCIVAHAVFNSLSMLTLWRMLVLEG